MPCYKGIAVSIHSSGAPLQEYGIQKQSRLSRVSSYIQVPQPRLNAETGKHEAARFAISITLLPPNHPIPYSTPEPTPDNKHPTPCYTGSDPRHGKAPKNPTTTTAPYISVTNSPNETIAAYIYFDGRGKEEVATLLRPGEETWVNSRWVQVSGGGLAEREFLFREVGLERWLNGLDLHGGNARNKVEKRRQRFERRRRRGEHSAHSDQNGDENMDKPDASQEVAASGSDSATPNEICSSVSEDSDDDEPEEATGQIKVAMFRVIASGEIKKGEYSPQFDAHEDDDDAESTKMDGDADVDHTTSFAKPKKLDPKSISTQTVTGIDGPEKPYAVFTFFYRGQRQLSKMGILPSAAESKAGPAKKRRSTKVEFSSLGPLKKTGTIGFTGFREKSAKVSKRKGSGADAGSDDDDSDDCEEKKLPLKVDKDDDDEKVVRTTLSPEDLRIQAELKAGIDRIKLKRRYSDENLASSSQVSPSPDIGNAPGFVTNGINVLEITAPVVEGSGSGSGDAGKNVGSTRSVPGLRGLGIKNGLFSTDVGLFGNLEFGASGGDDAKMDAKVGAETPSDSNQDGGPVAGGVSSLLKGLAADSPLLAASPMKKQRTKEQQAADDAKSGIVPNASPSLDVAEEQAAQGLSTFGPRDHDSDSDGMI